MAPMQSTVDAHTHTRTYTRRVAGRAAAEVAISRLVSLSLILLPSFVLASSFFSFLYVFILIPFLIFEDVAAVAGWRSFE